MDRHRFAVFAVTVLALVGVAVMIQVTITHTSAQMVQPKVTGKVTDTIIKSFDALGLPGIHSIQYRRLDFRPGAKVENVAFDDHAELCIAIKGSFIATLPDGSTRTSKKGDVFVVPLGTKFKVAVADSKLGYADLYWSINIKERK